MLCADEMLLFSFVRVLLFVNSILWKCTI